MNNVFAQELIPVIVVYVVLAVFLFYVYRYLRRRKKRHADSYDTDLNEFNKDVQNEDIQSMQLFGDRIIWNEYLEQSDKKIIYNSVKSRVKQHPVLKQLWKDVHFKTHGYDPLTNETKDDEWTEKTAFTSSRDDIIDQ